MIVTSQPQFNTQDDMGLGDGIPTVPEWLHSSASSNQRAAVLDGLDVEDDVADAFTRLSHIFSRSQQSPMSSTRLHDLACFVAHRLLQPLQCKRNVEPMSSTYGCLRWALVLYMFILQGSTYFSHEVLQWDLTGRLMRHLERHRSPQATQVDLWLLGIGLVASAGTFAYEWFHPRASAAVIAHGIDEADHAIAIMKSVVWLDVPAVENIFRQHWDTLMIEITADQHGISVPEEHVSYLIPES